MKSGSLLFKEEMETLPKMMTETISKSSDISKYIDEDVVEGEKYQYRVKVKIEKDHLNGVRSFLKQLVTLFIITNKSYCKR